MWSWISYSLKIGAFQDMIVFPSTKNRYILLKEKRVDFFSKAIKTIAFISFFKVLLAPVLFTPPPQKVYIYIKLYIEETVTTVDSIFVKCISFSVTGGSDFIQKLYIL